MNLILVDRTSGLKSTLERIRESYPRGSQVVLTGNNYLDVVKKVQFPPIYTEGWMILAYCRDIPYDVLASVGDGNNVVIYITRGEEESLELALELDLRHIIYRYLDDTVPSKEELQEYIIMKLRISPFMANYLGNLAKWNYLTIEHAIVALETLDKITKKDMKYHVPLHPNASMDDVIEYLLGFPERKPGVSIYSVVQRYSYSSNFLYSITIQKLELFLWIYSNIEIGFLDFRNYKEFRRKNIKQIRSYGKYSGISNYRLKRLIESYEYVSEEKIYLVLNLCRKYQETYPTVLGYLNFMKVGE